MESEWNGNWSNRFHINYLVRFCIFELLEVVSLLFLGLGNRRKNHNEIVALNISFADPCEADAVVGQMSINFKNIFADFCCIEQNVFLK